MVDCFKERSAQSATMKSNSLLTLHCVDLCTDVSLILQELPVLEWLAVLGHVSPLHRLTERRYVLLPKLRTAIHPLQGVRSPILIDVKNSFDLEVCIFVDWPLSNLLIDVSKARKRTHCVCKIIV